MKAVCLWGRWGEARFKPDNSTFLSNARRYDEIATDYLHNSCSYWGPVRRRLGSLPGQPEVLEWRSSRHLGPEPPRSPKHRTAPTTARFLSALATHILTFRGNGDNGSIVLLIVPIVPIWKTLIGDLLDAMRLAARSAVLEAPATSVLRAVLRFAFW